MIEFKAECGHTVRAKDEDAGGVVRCSYCGRSSSVPDSKETDLDFLFRDVDQSDDAPAGGRKKRARRLKGGKKRHRRPGEFDPFAVVIRLFYAAALISIVIFVGNKWLLPLFQEGGLTEQIAARRKDPPAEVRKRARKQTPSPTGLGLLTEPKPTGLYVNSTPPGADVYYMLIANAPASGRINRENSCKRATAGEPAATRNDGRYVVEVSFPVRDKNLKRYPGYMDFRRRVRDASADERQQLVEEYFLPDEAVVFVDEQDGQRYIVRQYRSVDVRRGESRGVRALFLPRILRADGKAFAIEILLQSQYLPKTDAYAFDEEDVKDELEFYNVPTSDWILVLEALSRTGVIPYLEDDGRVRLFEIGIHDGLFSAKVIRQPER